MTARAHEEELRDWERAAKWGGAYIGFVVAVLIATLTLSQNYSRAGLVIALLALSLPSLVAWILIDYQVKVNFHGGTSGARGGAGFLGFALSIAGFSILLAHFSVVAGILFPVLVVFWACTVFGVAVLNTLKRARK